MTKRLLYCKWIWNDPLIMCKHEQEVTFLCCYMLKQSVSNFRLGLFLSFSLLLVMRKNSEDVNMSELPFLSSGQAYVSKCRGWRTHTKRFSSRRKSAGTISCDHQHRKSLHNINYFWFNSTDLHNSQMTSANQIFFFSILCFHSKNENNSHSEVVACKLEVIVKADVILQGWAEC